MGLLSRIFKRKELTLDDPDIGTMTFERGGWTATSPHSFPFMLGFVADESGPTLGQREFLKQLAARLPEYDAAAKEFVNAHRVDRTPIDIYAIDIGPDAELKRGRFTIEYSDEAAEIIYGTEFDDWHPAIYYEDD